MFFFLCSKYYPEYLTRNPELAKDWIMNGVWNLLLGLPICYFCSYRKPGTRLLTFSVLVALLTSLAALFFLVHFSLAWARLPSPTEQVINRFPTYPETHSQITSVFKVQMINFVVVDILSLLFLIYSFKLLRKNKTIQYKEAFKLPANRSIFARFKTVSSEQELKSLTTELKGQFPELSKMIRWKSKLRKKKLALS